MDPDLPLTATLEVRERCLCLSAQRAARVLARRFDAALKPFGLTNGQFSILMSLNRPEPPRISDLSPFLAMDRTTLTAALKVLERRGLVASAPDPADRRNRQLTLSTEGRELLKSALPAWRAEHDALDDDLGADPATLKALLDTVR
ncbi:MarR family transcriptional regulator [Citreicella sp. C3M06]|uniref:MarR family winged helix-turn-helix transcriptional regulator n=1 Tax=Citreicella sp. C3M06 TaxID=2841564 RepID=UPI001C085A2C|nr:MarR family transcriptional regulator [Citreicella sp. C3M06]MBU2962559.1 MarR family transcriptional regulator [Citreicella sp. C3M06]